MGLTAVIGAAAAISAYSAYAQGQAQAEAADYNRKMANANADLVQGEAQAAIEAQQRQQQRQIGAAIADYGASGVDPSTGSPMDVLTSSVREATLDNLTTRYNYDVKADSLRNQASLAGLAADNYRTSSVLNSLGALGQGAASYAMYSGSTAKPASGGMGQVQ